MMEKIDFLDKVWQLMAESACGKSWRAEKWQLKLVDKEKVA